MSKMFALSLVWTNLAHFLDQHLNNLCCNLTKATAESKATAAMIEEGFAAGPGFWVASELEPGPLLTVDPGFAETSELEPGPLLTVDPGFAETSELAREPLLNVTPGFMVLWILFPRDPASEILGGQGHTHS